MKLQRKMHSYILKVHSYILKVGRFLKALFSKLLFLNRWEDPYYARRQNDNQLSVRVSGRYGRKLYYRGDAHMFVEDMYTGIMPFMIYRGEREKYPAKMVPQSSRKEQIITDGISSHGSHRLGDALCDFVRSTAHVLFSEGTALYEIVYKKDESNVLESFELVPIRTSYGFRFLRTYYQLIPWWEAKESRVKVQIVRIPTEKTIRIDFPKQLGGRRKINRLLKRLWQLSEELIPKFQMEAMGKNEQIGFDLEEFSRGKYLEIAKVSRKLGWAQRQYSTDYVTEYYSMTRYLREKKVEALLRATIFSKLNEVLNCRLLNLGVNVGMENLFTVEDVEEQERKLKKGDVAFEDVYKSLSI